MSDPATVSVPTSTHYEQVNGDPNNKGKALATGKNGAKDLTASTKAAASTKGNSCHCDAKTTKIIAIALMIVGVALILTGLGAAIGGLAVGATIALGSGVGFGGMGVMLYPWNSKAPVKAKTLDDTDLERMDPSEKQALLKRDLLGRGGPSAATKVPAVHVPRVTMDDTDFARLKPKQREAVAAKFLKTKEANKKAEPAIAQKTKAAVGPVVQIRI